jgi:hypothetical protein
VSKQGSLRRLVGVYCIRSSLIHEHAPKNLNIMHGCDCESFTINNLFNTIIMHCGNF